jgi:hypothetical protein
MAEILMAAESAAVTLDDGIPHMIEAGRTLAHADHPIVTGCPNLWKSLKVHYSTDEPEPGPQGQEAAQPDPKAVRAWAAGQGIEVSAKGKLAQDVVDAYVAAQQEA